VVTGVASLAETEGYIPCRLSCVWRMISLVWRGSDSPPSGVLYLGQPSEQLGAVGVHGEWRRDSGKGFFYLFVFQSITLDSDPSVTSLPAAVGSLCSLTASWWGRGKLLMSFLGMMVECWLFPRFSPGGALPCFAHFRAWSPFLV